jgi:hypothetical protein
MGVVFFAFGVMLIYKTWWRVSFDFSSDVNAACYVALIVLGAAFIWFGGGIVFWHFGLIP